MGEPMEFDVRSYPPLDLKQNMNALVQDFGEPFQRVCQMAVSEYDTNSSAASIFSDSDAESQWSSLDSSDYSDAEEVEYDIEPLPAAINHLEEVGQHDDADLWSTPMWVELPQGFDTRGQRVCWAPAVLKQRIGPRTGTVPRARLQLLKNYELAVDTNIHWLNKEIRCEKLDPYRQEFQGPAALLTISREHDRNPGHPYHMKVTGPTRMGKLTPRPRAGVNLSD